MQDDLKKILQLCYADGGTPEMLAYLLDLDNLREEFNKVVRDYQTMLGFLYKPNTIYVFARSSQRTRISDTAAFFMAYINDTPVKIHTNKKADALRIKRALTMQLLYVDAEIWYEKTNFFIVRKNTLCQQQ